MAYDIIVKSMREAQVTNLETGITVMCKIEPYARDGKPNGYVVLDPKLDAPQRRYNIANFTGPVEERNVTLTGKAKSAIDWSSFWGKDTNND